MKDSTKYPWDENVPFNAMRRVNEAAQKSQLTDEERGRLLHHVANCPKCLEGK